MHRLPIHHRACKRTHGSILARPLKSYAASLPRCGESSSVRPPPAAISTTPRLRLPALYRAWFVRVPTSLRFLASAAIGNLLFFALDAFIYQNFLSKVPAIVASSAAGAGVGAAASLEVREGGRVGVIGPASQVLRDTAMGLLSQYGVSISFLMAYFVVIAFQHVINAILVFGWSTINSREKYFEGFVACYAARAQILQPPGHCGGWATM
mmetsp:Transcript_14188/g.31022  ORF Transcript_14188/g.31022 Transcript_14188/m.31022 type:complete len:210 (-) Transcript_14188:292-921(-)